MQPNLSAIRLKIEIAGGINKFQISSNVVKELLVEMFAAKRYLGEPDDEIRLRMQANFFEILKDTKWFRDFEKCILKNLNFFWRHYKGLEVPDYWFWGGVKEDSVEMAEKIITFLKEKLQLSEEEEQCL